MFATFIRNMERLRGDGPAGWRGALSDVNTQRINDKTHYIVDKPLRLDPVIHMQDI
jgi:hypothetical protein